MKYKQFGLYIIFGIITTIINYVIFWLCTYVFNINYLIANAIAWFCAIVVAYITSKLFVFHSKTAKSKTILESILFLLVRIFTLSCEQILLYIGYNIMNQYILKIITTCIIVVLNFILSKFVVFNREMDL